jgi:uncharacterized protein (TIGR02117 family)
MGRLAALAVVLLAELGCARGAPIAWPPPESGPLRDVWVVRHGWHTRIAVRRADVDPRIWPESQAFGPVAYVEVGWGDRDFYPEDDPSIWDAIDAVIRPTPAALHVGGFDPPPPAFLPGSAMVRVPVPAEGFERLTRYLHESYEHTAAGDPIAIRPGYYPRSRFYLATGSYHAFNTSNTWTARALQVAGAPVTPAGTVTAGRVMAQARRVGQAIPPAGAGRGAQPALDAARPGADNTLRSTPSPAEDRTMDSSTNGLGLEPGDPSARRAVDGGDPVHRAAAAGGRGALGPPHRPRPHDGTAPARDRDPPRREPPAARGARRDRRRRPRDRELPRPERAPQAARDARSLTVSPAFRRVLLRPGGPP